MGNIDARSGRMPRSQSGTVAGYNYRNDPDLPDEDKGRLDRRVTTGLRDVRSKSERKRRGRLWNGECVSGFDASGGGG